MELVPLSKPKAMAPYFACSDRFGSYLPDVRGSFSHAVVWVYRDHRESEATPTEYLRTLVKACDQIRSAGLRIHLDLNGQAVGAVATPVEKTIRELSPFWDLVDFGSLADEPSWDAAKTKAYVNSVKAACKKLGLRVPPLGVVYEVSRFGRIKRVCDSLDLVIPEWYTSTAEGFTASAKNVADLKRNVERSFDSIPKSKGILPALQCYSRNFTYAGIGGASKASPAYKNAVQCMTDLLPVFYQGLQDSRVVGGLCFSWGRPSGCADYPILASAVKKLAKAVTGKK